MYFTVNGGAKQYSPLGWKAFRKSFQKNHRIDRAGSYDFTITDSLGEKFLYELQDD